MTQAAVNSVHDSSQQPLEANSAKRGERDWRHDSEDDQEFTPFVSHKTATSRVAALGLNDLYSESERLIKIRKLEQRGYNTIVLPLMKHGRLTAQQGLKKKDAPLGGILPKTLTALENDSETSIWISIDPLSASMPNTKVPSDFARNHVDWLMRNTNGRSTPVGKRGFSPLFSWLNEDYRRYLTDLVVSLAENRQFTGIVIDLRAYPVRSSDPERWYCCSYSSQKRVLKELELPFNDLLQHGTRSEIHHWQRWVYNELTAFIRYLKSRVRVARYDIFWKILVNYGNPHDTDESPWTKWLNMGLFEEVIVAFNPAEVQPNSVIEQIDVAAAHHRLLLPAFETEQVALESWRDLSTCCIPGFMIEFPDFESVKSLPAFQSHWEHSGALEDNPHETCIALSKFLAKRFTRNHRLGRYYALVAKALDEFEPTSEMIGQLIGKVTMMEKRVGDAAKMLSPTERGLTREIELLVRLLPTIRMKPEVY